MGEFKLHSGSRSRWKIDCDALTNDDYETLAWIVVDKFKIKYRRVIGIPNGGTQFAVALLKYTRGDVDTTLIVDDVLTTGKSMNEMMKKAHLPVIGVVIFARGPYPEWVYPIFTLGRKRKSYPDKMRMKRFYSRFKNQYHIHNICLSEVLSLASPFYDVPSISFQTTVYLFAHLLYIRY